MAHKEVLKALNALRECDEDERTLVNKLLADEESESEEAPKRRKKRKPRQALGAGAAPPDEPVPGSEADPT